MTAREARVSAQAKINLRLRVLAKRGDGYHALDTVFLRLELADRVGIRISDGRTIEVAGPQSLVAASGPDENNLALRAAAAFAERAGWPDGFHVSLEKRIPVGAGLGGGSADAGAVLRAFNSIAPSPLSSSELHAMAASLGSDVPFMASELPMAHAWGRGERLGPAGPLPSRLVIVGVPKVAISTREAYEWLGMAAKEEAGEFPLLPADAFASWERAASFAENDFEKEVFIRHPVCARLKSSLLERGARMALLSGSGSAVFGIFDQNADLAALENAEWSEILTRTASHVVPVERMD